MSARFTTTEIISEFNFNRRANSRLFVVLRPFRFPVGKRQCRHYQHSQTPLHGHLKCPIIIISKQVLMSRIQCRGSNKCSLSALNRGLKPGSCIIILIQPLICISQSSNNYVDYQQATSNPNQLSPQQVDTEMHRIYFSYRLIEMKFSISLIKIINDSFCCRLEIPAVLQPIHLRILEV